MNLDLTQLIAIAAALGWASGLRLYAVVFITGLAGWLGWVHLPGDLHVLSHPVVIGAAGLMLFIEFFVDKIPGLDSIWDAVHTFVRIPAGAALAGAVFGGDQASWVTAAALMGGTLAATSHAAKLTTRASANTSPEPFSNIALSLLGDGAVPIVLWLSWVHPVVALAVVAAAVVVSLVVVVVLWRFIARLMRRMRGGYAAAME
ncbi:MAG: DUF4126 domain-containing protein [Caldimonas sp.]